MYSRLKVYLWRRKKSIRAEKFDGSSRHSKLPSGHEAAYPAMENGGLRTQKKSADLPVVNMAAASSTKWPPALSPVRKTREESKPYFLSWPLIHSSTSTSSLRIIPRSTSGHSVVVHIDYAKPSAGEILAVLLIDYILNNRITVTDIRQYCEYFPDVVSKRILTGYVYDFLHYNER